MRARNSAPDWVAAAAVDDLTDESAVHVDVGDSPVCLARSGGRFYAVLDRCSHQNVPLSEGDVDDGTVECWLHGSRFDLATGRALGPPATKPVPTFPVRVEGDTVYVQSTPGR